MPRSISILILSLSILTPAHSQELPYSVSNESLYHFLDELASTGLISLNSTIKPYSRKFIAECLETAKKNSDQLSPRRQKELDFYLKDFGKELNEGKDWDRRKDLFYYKDDLFTFTVNPILGGEAFFNGNGNATCWRNGAEAWSYVGRWSFFASLRDNHENPLLGKPEYLTKREGGHIKTGTDWSEMQGGVSYAWEWGSAALVKDRLQWGNGYNGSNIFGGHVPAFFQFRLHIKPVEWFDFNYFHGWLNSMVVDSSRSYWVAGSYGMDYREVYHKKFIAANMFSFQPFKRFRISAGNSIIYSDYDIHPVYLIPVLFFKSVDHMYNSGIDNMNSQMFIDISSRQVKHLHLYGTMFIDELSVSRITDPGVHNFFSYKAGFRLSDFPFSDLSLTTELTYTMPLVFRHYVPTLTFETNRFNMGHYLKDNSREWYIALDYRPVRASVIRLYFIDAIRGPDYTELGAPRLGNPLLETIEWHNTTVGLNAGYQLINDLHLWLSVVSSNITGREDWTGPFFYGKNTTFNVGVTFGY
ncbi:MAG TPA: hypothetical protein VMW76_05490 [Bacteroidales bacterium]|nr:hypothetical protein [Bacteroidales bacterium]